MKFFFILILSLNTAFAKDIVIGSKQFSESIIMSELLAQYLEYEHGLGVKTKHALGGTKVAFEALLNNDIDIYPDYTGTGYSMILKQNQKRTPKEIFDYTNSEFQKKYNIHWSKPVGFNNTYVLAVKRDDTKFKNITTVSEFVKISKNLSLASSYEFMERKDGYEAFRKTYGLNITSQNVKSMEAGLMYSAIDNNQVEAIICYSTDGRIKSSKLKLLIDDLSFFPPYQASYLVSTSTLLKYPEIKEAFDKFADLINEKEMIELNFQVDGEKKDPKLVARNFLIQKKLIDEKLTKHQKTNSFWEFVVLKKNYLFKITMDHLKLSFAALLLALIFSLPLGILMSENRLLEKIIFPIINTIQTIPSLALLGFLIPLIGIGFTPALIALFLYSLLPLIRNTFIGIKGIDESLIISARSIGLTENQILMRVKLPIALPVIFGGLRTAAVIVVGTATLAALVGAGGLGDPIFRGVSTVNSNLILLGALPAAILAIFIDKFVGILEYIFVSEGLKNNSRN